MKNPLYSGSVKDFLNQAPKSIEGLEKELTQERQRTNNLERRAKLNAEINKNRQQQFAYSGLGKFTSTIQKASSKAIKYAGKAIKYAKEQEKKNKKKRHY